MGAEKIVAEVVDTSANSKLKVPTLSQLSTQPDNNSTEIAAHQPGAIKVIRRNNKVTSFNPDKISVAMTKAFLSVEGGTAAASTRIHETVAELTDQAATYALGGPKRADAGYTSTHALASQGPPHGCFS